MSKSLSCIDFQRLIEITVNYMLTNNLTDLIGGYRTNDSHFSKICELFLQENSDSFRISSFNLYVKWRRNDRNFRSSVQKGLSEKEKNQECRIDSDFGRNFSIIFSDDEWRKLLLRIGDGERKKFTSYANEIIATKIQSRGINCFYKIKHNSFSTSKSSSKFYWSGVLKCIECSNTVRAFIRNKPKNNDGCLLSFIGKLDNCREQVSFIEFKKRLQGVEREAIQKEVSLKGVTNFKSEANFFGKISKYKKKFF